MKPQTASNLLLALAASTTLATVAGGQFEINWHTIDGGGLMHSSNGTFELSGTIGQPDAGSASNSTYELTGGFWFMQPPSDCNADGLVTLQDHDQFVACLSGPATPPGADCDCFDLDNNGRVELADFAELQAGLTTP